MTTKRRIIGFSGKSGSGKDTAAAALYTYSSSVFRRFAFATKLKEAAALICGFTPDQCYESPKDWIDPRWGFTPRFFFQTLGTNVARAIDPDIWVKALRVELERYTHCNAVITDVRFPNEAKMIHDIGGIVVRIERDGLSLNTHESETALDNYDFDHVITNNGTIEELHVKVRALAEGVNVTNV